LGRFFRPLNLVTIVLLVELFDELVYGAREAAWPLIRTDLGLSYAGIGVLLAVPGVVASLIEPSFGLLADTGRRRTIIVAGGVFFAAALAFTGLAWGYIPLLVAFIVMDTASGAFVTMSQAALADHEPGREERNMARWTLAGSVGVVLGPLVLAGALFAGLGWRSVFFAFGAAIVPLVIMTRRIGPGSAPHESVQHALRAAFKALTRFSVLRWVFLLELANLMGDVFLGFIALFLVDVGHLSALTAALAIGIWTGAGLVGDALLIPLLARTSGIVYLRLTALVALAVYPAFLLAAPPAARLALLGLLGLLHAGWYAIPIGRVYGELRGSSGVAASVATTAGLLGQLSPLLLGLAAQRFGLAAAMWIPILAPVALLVALPKRPK
jgi:MFS transporter, FSR family, fosmidomycin resistance protein